MTTDPNNPADWLLLARDRLEKADALFERFGASWSGIELLHEAAARYLKAFLIHHGWSLVKTHDLSRLLAEACGFECRFDCFADMTQSLTEQFWEQHYPGGDLDEIGHDYPALRQSLGEMVRMIEAAIEPES